MIPAGWRHLAEATLDSTQARLVALAEHGEPDRTALTAERQMAGLGRNGRAWQSPPGNLHLSVLIRPGGVARDAPQWALLAAVALVEAAAATDPDPDTLRLKWPNDLLRGGGKAAGILAQSTLGPSGIAWLVIGFGVNLATAPSLPERPTAILPGGVAPMAFAGRLLARLDIWRETVATDGFGPVRTAWLAHGPALGEALAVRAGVQHLRGRFAGLAEDGSLRLDTAQGTVRVTAGEVVSDAGGT